MNWLWVIIIVAVIGGILGYLFSDKDKGAGFLGGAFTAGAGCAYVIFQIFIFGAAIAFIIWLFSFLFG